MKGVIPGNARWPYQLMLPGDEFEVDDEGDFNSAKSAVSQFKSKNPGTMFTQRISCARCGVPLERGVMKRKHPCRCKKGPVKLLTIARWS
jgi:hypothetical protein